MFSFLEASLENHSLSNEEAGQAVGGLASIPVSLRLLL